MIEQEKVMRRIPVVVVVAATLLGGALLGGLSVARGQEASPPAIHPLVGSWLVAVTLEGQEPGSGSPPATTSLVTFFADGNVLVANAGQLPSLPPGSGLFFTEGHGQWAGTGDRAARASVVSLVLDQTGGLSSTTTVSTTVEVDDTGNAYTGTLTIGSTSSTGTDMGAQQATVEATRIQTEPAGTPES
jgi:hypothetical protein